MIKRCAVGAALSVCSLSAGAWTWIQDDSSKIDLTGNWQYDYGRVDDGTGNGSEDTGFWRRQRLAVYLERKDVLDLTLEYDFAVEEWTDALLRIRGVLGGQVLLGQFKQPFGLDELTSDKRSLFAEPALIGGFALSRRLGANWQWNPGAVGVQFGFFDANLNGLPSTSGGAARLWWTPRNAAGEVWHLGMALTNEEADDDRFGLSSRPETRLADLRVARTGTFTDVSGVRRMGLEGLVIQGSTYLQAEWLGADVQRDAHADFNGDGWYVQAGWLTGGAQRGYKNGTVQAPDQGNVFEFGARAARVDLDDGLVRGGRANSLGVGVTWYWKPEVRVMLEHSKTDVDDSSGRDDVKATELRLQYVF